MVLNLSPIIVEEIDSALAEVPVTLGSKEYILREITGGQAEQYRNRQMKGAKFVDGKASLNLDNLASIESYLVSLSLHEVLKDKDTQEITGYKPVPIDVIRGFSPRILKVLHERVQSISGLDDTSEENLLKAKKDIEDKLEELKKGDPVKND